MRARVIARIHRPHLFSWAALWWLTISILLVFAAAGCRGGAAALDPDVPRAGVAATINGTVRAPEQPRAAEGRLVEVVNIETAERHLTTTSTTGAFSVKVKPGKYRVELALREGEAILRSPGVMHVDQREADAKADFVVVTRRATESAPSTRPRGPAYRIDPGLGSPIA